MFLKFLETDNLFLWESWCIHYIGSDKRNETIKVWFFFNKMLPNEIQNHLTILAYANIGLHAGRVSDTTKQIALNSENMEILYVAQPFTA